MWKCLWYRRQEAQDPQDLVDFRELWGQHESKYVLLVWKGQTLYPNTISMVNNDQSR